MAGPGVHILEDGGYTLGIFNGGELRSLDGAHSSPEDVAKAKKIIEACGLGKPGDTYMMLHATEVPDLDPPINEDAAANVRHMVNVTGR